MTQRLCDGFQNARAGAPVKPTSVLTRLFRLARAALHLARGVTIAALVFPFVDGASRARHVQRWSARLVEVFAVRVEVRGSPHVAATRPLMLVANHVSWLDIFAINAVRPVRFVAKAEIRRWPVIGWLCERGGTLFIERARKRHTSQINAQIVAALERGEVFAVFPEGSTTKGDVVLPFHASLLQPALVCGAVLQPVAVRYLRADGSLCAEADYEGDKSLVETVRLMITQPVIVAQLEFLAPLDSADRHRREIAHEAAQRIANALGVPAPRSRAKISSGR